MRPSADRRVRSGLRADAGALKVAYATVTHSVSLAMAKRSGCENDGGLDARPSCGPA